MHTNSTKQSMLCSALVGNRKHKKGVFSELLKLSLRSRTTDRSQVAQNMWRQKIWFIPHLQIFRFKKNINCWNVLINRICQSKCCQTWKDRANVHLSARRKIKTYYCQGKVFYAPLWCCYFVENSIECDTC